MLRIERSSNGNVIFTLSGRIEVEGVDELQRLFPPPAARCGLALASGVEISRSLGFI